MRGRLNLEAGVVVPPALELDEADTISLGRNPRCTLVLEDRFASKRHAELAASDGRWILRDLQSTNGTRVNNKRVTEPVTLTDGDVIGIGEIRLRFSVPRLAERTDVMPAAPANGKGTAEAPAENSNPDSPVPSTAGSDTLASLVTFLTDMQQLATPSDLVSRALAAVCRQTRATMAGYLSLDPEDPVPKMVYPPRTAVDTHLSRQLTQQVLREGHRIWLSADPGGVESESLADFRDALCIPLRPADSPDTPPLGALHVYKSGGTFGEREARFCEVLAGFLAGQLRSLRARRALEADNSRLRTKAAGSSDELIGDSKAMQLLRQQIDRFADGPATVLITGESGVGKELVAASLHRQSRRHDSPFVAINCPALPGALLEAELFGHKAGSFTNATADRAGCFAQADEGSLFLDEIGELTLEAQAKLLRVLETRTFNPVGGEEQKVDVRVIAATNRDLQAAVQKGLFRRDLFWRLAITISVPPLREHAEDIPQLVEHFLDQFAAVYRRRPVLTPAASERLQVYSWPGNVRQLRAVLETAVANSEGSGCIDVGDLRLMEGPVETTGGPPSLNLKEVEAWTIRKAMQRHNGNRTRAANELGIHRDTLISKLKLYGIDGED